MKKIVGYALKYIILISAFFISGIAMGLDDCIHYPLLEYTHINFKMIWFASLIFGVGAFFIEAIFDRKISELQKGIKKIIYICSKVLAYILCLCLAIFMSYCMSLDKENVIFGVQGNVFKPILYRYFEGYFLIVITLGIYFVFLNKKKRNQDFTFEKFIARAFFNLSVVLCANIIIFIGELFVTAIVYEMGIFISDFTLFGLLMPTVIFAFLFTDWKTGKISRLLQKYILPIGVSGAGLFFYLVLFIHWICKTEIADGFIFLTYILVFLVITFWMMAEEYNDNKLYSKIVSYLPLFFVPFIFLQIYYVVTDIGRYGIDPVLYICIVLIVYEMTVIFTGLIWKRKREVFLPIFCVLITIVVYAPKINIVDFFETDKKEGEILHKEQEDDIDEIYSDIHREAFELDFVFSELDVSEYDEITAYINVDPYNLEGDREIFNVDFENYKFWSSVDGNEITINIQPFIDRCLYIDKQYSSYIGGATFRKELENYYTIPVDESKVFCIQQVFLEYEESTNDGKEFFQWEKIQITGFLLEKS